MSDESRTKRSAKKPAWMNDEMLIDPAEVEAEVKIPKPHPKKPHAGLEMAQRMAPVHHEVVMPRPVRPSGRMCSNPQCKNPFDSPQWRRGPLGPGTLCNACGTRYARLQAKMNGDKKGKMRPQERAEWEAFEQQRMHPQVPQQQTWRMHVQSFVQREQQQQYYGQDDDYAGYEDSDYGYDERSYGSQHGGHRQEQLYDAEHDMHDPDAQQDGQNMCHDGTEGLSDSPDIASRAAIAAAVAAAAAAAAGVRSSRPVWRSNRQHIPTADAATDSQEDEAAAYSCQEGAEGATGAAGSPAAPSFLHLLAVGEAMIKTENVAPQERRAAYTEVVGKGMGPEPERVPARAAGGEAAQGVKRSRFALEAEEQQGGRPASGAEPTALQRALERCGAQAGPQRAKPAGSEHVAADRFERLLAEAEACVRARSVSPCMLKGMPGTSPINGNPPAARPITPLQLGVNAVDAAAGKAGLPRSLLGAELPQQDGLANFMLPAAAMRRRPASAGASDGFGRSRHTSLAQALAAAAAAAEADSPHDGDDRAGMGAQGSPQSQFDMTASNAGSGGDRGDAAKGFDAAVVDASYGADGAAGGHVSHELGQMPGQHGPVPGDMQGHMHMQALLSQMGQFPSTEPSPGSKMLMADEVLSPTTMLMPSGRPRKQARVQGPEVMVVASASGGSAGRGPASGSQLQRAGTPGAAAASDGAAANMVQSDFMHQQMMAQHALSQPMLQSMMLQQGSGQHQLPQGLPAPGPLPTATELQQAGHRPVVLACQLVLQQQANPTALRPLFAAPASSANPVQPRPENMEGLGASAELVSNALQLAQAGSGGNAQTHLDQLKAVTMSAQAAAATASAVAAATALLWQQLQQQEQARARQQQQDQAQHVEQGHEMPPVQGQVGNEVGADAGVDAAAGEPAPPGSPAADPVGAGQGASGSISRSSSSSTSAAGLSTAPGESHGVDKPPASQGAIDQPQQGPARTTPGPTSAAEVAGPAAGADVPSMAGSFTAMMQDIDAEAAPQPLPGGQHMGPFIDSHPGFDAGWQA